MCDAIWDALCMMCVLLAMCVCCLQCVMMMMCVCVAMCDG